MPLQLRSDDLGGMEKMNTVPGSSLGVVKLAPGPVLKLAAFS